VQSSSDSLRHWQADRLRPPGAIIPAGDGVAPGAATAPGSGAPPDWARSLGWTGPASDLYAAFASALLQVVVDDQGGTQGPLWPDLWTRLNSGPALALAGLFGISDEQTLQVFLERVDRLRDQIQTQLEVWEAEQTRYGIYDTRISGANLVAILPATAEVGQDTHYLAREMALRFLMADMQILPLGGGAAEAFGATGTAVATNPGAWEFRSRISEVVRLIVKLRQRFENHVRSAQSPALVSDVKFEVKPREVPNRWIPLDQFVGGALADAQELALAGAATGAVPAAELEKAMALLREVLEQNGKTTFAPFQQRAFRRVITRLITGAAADRPEGTVVGAGTGSGKTLAYFAPALFYVILERVLRGRKGTKSMAIYPRTKLAEKQFEEFFGLIRILNGLPGQSVKVTLGIEYGQTRYTADQLFEKWAKWPTVGDPVGVRFPAMTCPDCQSPLIVPMAGRNNPAQRRLICSSPNCTFSPVNWVVLTKDEMGANPPDVLVLVTESLSDRLTSPAHQAIFGNDDYPAPALVMVDEIHLHTGTKGMQIGYVLRRLAARLRAAPEPSRRPLHFIGLSATIAAPQEFFHDLTGLEMNRIAVEVPNREAGETRVDGAEYFIFVKPKSTGESAVLSTLIQTAMAVVHNMWQPDGDRVYKTFGFVNSLDIVYRWQRRLLDAEQNLRLFDLRSPATIARRPLLQDYFNSAEQCAGCVGGPNPACRLFQEGECWWFMAHGRGLADPMKIKTISSQDEENQVEADDDLVIATSSLEVGYDDPTVMAVIQYLSPANAASFVQRKGRGGRQVGTRPLMVTVLSPYRPIDVFNYQNHERLMDPEFRRLPLNPGNKLVQRIHGFYALLDWLGQRAAAEGAGYEAPSLNREMVAFIKRATADEANLNQIRAYIREAFGLPEAEVAALLKSPASEGILSFGLLKLVRRFESPNRPGTSVKDLMADYVPSALFNDINLPELTVDTGRKAEPIRIALGLSETALGKVSYRWKMPYWFPLDSAQSIGQNRLSVSIDEDRIRTAGELAKVDKGEMPLRVQPTLTRGGLYPDLRVFRPERIIVKPFTDPKGTVVWSMDPASGLVSPSTSAKPGTVRLLDRTSSHPLSFYQVRWDEGRMGDHHGDPRQLGLFAAAKVPLLSDLVLLSGNPWLQVRKIYAGATASLVGEDSAEWSGKVFYRTPAGEPAALGFDFKTEGVVFKLNPDLELALSPGQGLLRHLRHKAFAAGLQRWAQTESQNLFTVQRLTDALLAMTRELNRPMAEAAGEFAAGLHDVAFAGVLQSLYGHLARQVRAQMELMAADAEFRGAVAAQAREAFGGDSMVFVRDVFVHSLEHALRKGVQVVAGVENDEDLAGHAEMTADYENPRPEISLFELGMYGTGLMRALHQRLREAPEEFWREVERLVMECPVATGEEFLQQVLSLPEAALRAIAGRVQAVEGAPGPLQRTAAFAELAGWFRQRGGLYLTTELYRNLRKLFIRPFELADFAMAQPLENWTLYRQVERFRQNLERMTGRQPLDEEMRLLLYREVVAGGTTPLRELLDLHRQNRQVLFTRLLQTIADNLKRRPLYDQFLMAINSVDQIRTLAEQTPEERVQFLTGLCTIDAKVAPGFEEALFASLGAGLTYAELYWHHYTGNVDAALQQRVEEALIQESLQEAIGRRILQSCYDGCPDCLEGGCELDSPAVTRFSLSRRLLSDVLAGLKQRWTVALSAAYPEQTAGRARELFRGGALRVHIRYKAGQEPQLVSAVGQLKACGIPMPDDRVYGVELHSSGLARLDLADGCLYEVVLQQRRG